MTVAATKNTQYTIPGLQMGSATVSRTAVAGLPPIDTTIAVGKTVTAWVKTDANTAGCNLPADHGYTDGNFDVYWDGGMRYGVPGTIATNALTLDGGAGDDFPASATTGIIVCRQVSFDIDFDGDKMEAIAAISDQRISIDFQDSGNASLLHVEIAPETAGNNADWSWFDGEGTTTPITGNPVDHICVSCGSALTAANFKMGGLLNADT